MAAAVQPGLLDLTGKSQAAFPIRLGASISKSTTDATHFASIRYNHKPALKQSDDVKATIEQGDEGDELVLNTEDGEYKYGGSYGQQEGSFVLVFRGEGKEREMVLERLDGVHSFNLISTPAESDAAKLERKYPHVTDAEMGEDDLFGDDDEDAPPDDANPFDFRHFLKAETEKAAAAASQSATELSRSTVSTPVVQPATRATPATRAKPAAKAKAPAKRKPAGEKPNPKRVKAGQEPAAAAVEPAPAKTTRGAKAAKPEMPKLRVDRKASVRRPSVEDSGELILENETPATEKPPKATGAMAWALNGSLNAGPISLASAASSPGLTASVPEKEAEEPQEYEFDFGDGSEVEDEQDNSELVLENAPDEDDGELVVQDQDDDDDDADVDEHLELPSPAQNHRPSLAAAAPVADEDDDDMEKQLALAMAADDEEEESEEE